MNYKLVGTFIILFTFLLISCSSRVEKHNIPNYTISNKFGIDSSELIYQYYQKYGFTDLCEEIKMIAKIETSPNFKSRLPINPSDLNRISQSNRLYLTDTLQLFKFNHRQYQRDIELEYIEYIQDSTLTLDMQNGSYNLVIDEFYYSLKIYNEKSKILFIDVYQCDENRNLVN